MTSRDDIARATAAALDAAPLKALPAVLGFDGFVDQIIHVVGTRHAHDRFSRLEQTTAFAEQVRAAAGKSANVELVVTREKLGGNGPIMGNALATLGLPVTYLGSVGTAAEGEAVHPVFADFAARATLIPLAPPALTHALEFLDGKVMLGNLASLSTITWDRLLDVLGREKLLALCEKATLLGLLNWTMLPHLTEIWRHVAEEIAPRLTRKPRRVFVDLADPRKRSPDDQRRAMETLTRLNAQIPVTLGLNDSEADQIAAALGIQTPPAESAPREAAVLIRERLALDTVVIHPRKCAAAATSGILPADVGRMSTPQSAYFAGPYTAQPKISTGAGDHFNAGFALGQLLALPLENALCLATAVSGYYVRNAASPTAAQLSEFLRHLPDAA